MTTEDKFGSNGKLAGVALNSVLLDRNRDRVVVFYGRVSTEHEAQLSALENQLQWYDDQAKYHANWKVLRKYIDEYIHYGEQKAQTRNQSNFSLKLSTR